MAHTFDDVSKSSATNYLFFFAQRALAHHNEPPTPPPLNALGLPCNAMCRLWARLYPEQAVRHEYLSIYLKSIKAAGKWKMLAAAKEKAAKEKAAKEKAAMELKGRASWNFSTGSWSFSTVSLTAEKIQPLADKIKEYILDHLDDGEQEVVKRDMLMVTSFREQREASENSFRVQREESGKQREEFMNEVETEVQSMQLRFDDVHAKLDETTSKLDETIQLIRNLADPWPR